jgi:hypothetical protein
MSFYVSLHKITDGDSMTIFEFTASIISSIAWPLAIIIVLLILRKQISQLISNIQKFSFQGLEIETRKEIKQLKEEVKHPTDEPFVPIQIPDRYIKLVSISTHAAINEAWKELQSAIINAAISINIDNVHKKSIAKLVEEIESRSEYGWRVPNSDKVERLSELINQVTQNLFHEYPETITFEIVDICIQYASAYSSISESAG